jgi:hypothetical protein
MRMALFAKIHTNLKLTQQKERWKTNIVKQEHCITKTIPETVPLPGQYE